MTTCTFAGHRQVFAADLGERVNDAIERLLTTDTQFLFYTGGMGDFDNLCSAAVRRARREHPALEIRLLLVLPYMKQAINTDRDYYEESYDDIFVPMELLGAHCKAAIPLRNRWMIDRADVLLAYVRRDFGGAYEALRYARKRPEVFVVNLGE